MTKKYKTGLDIKDQITDLSPEEETMTDHWLKHQEVCCKLGDTIKGDGAVGNVFKITFTHTMLPLWVYAIVTRDHDTPESAVLSMDELCIAVRKGKITV